MRKRTLAAVVALGLGLGLLLLSLHSREAQTPSGDTLAVASGPGRRERAVRPERSGEPETRATGEGGTPPLEHRATEADGVLLVEVFAKERPVPGASVRLYWRGPRDPNLGEATWRLAGSASTDARGHARLPSRPGSYLVTARAPGLATQSRDVMRPQGEALTRLRLTLEAGHGLSGRIVEKGTGEPLPLVELALIAHGRKLKPWETVEAPAEERVFAHGDARGSFQVEGLAAGTWRLRAEAPGYGPAVLDGVRVPAEGPLEIALSRAGIIEGFVVDAEGRPAPGAEVRVSGGATQQVVTTGQGGGFSAEVEAGIHTVSARRGSEAGALDTPVVVVAGGTARDVRVRLGAGALIEGRVVARAGQVPVAGATVDVSPAGANGDSGRAVTDEEGHFTVDGLAPGVCDVVVAATGFSEALRLGLTLSPGERFLADFELVGTGAVEGTVRDVAGHPLSGVRMEVTESWTPEGLSSTPVEARTNAEGHYRLEGLAPGRAVVFAHREGASAGQGQFLFLEEGDTARADFTLAETGTLEGVVRTAPGRWPDKPLQVYAHPKRPGVFSEGGSGHAEVGRAGTFRMQLPPGSYEVTAEYPEDDGLHQPESKTVTVEPGKMVRVELSFESSDEGLALLRGHVLEPDGTPSPSATVVGWHPSDLDALHFWVRSDAEGRFRHAISEGITLSVVYARNGGRLGRVHEVRVGQEVVVRLQPAASVRGRVVRANGAPVRGFSLGVLPLEPGSSPWTEINQEFPAERFELKDVPGEGVMLEARTRDGARGTARVVLAPGASAEVEILLEDMARLGGRAVDLGTGAPLGGASVLVPVGLSSRFHVLSGADGRFLIEGLPAGEHPLLIFGLDGSQEHRRVALEAGQLLELGDVPVGASPL